MKLNAAQYTFLTLDTPYSAYVGGMGSAKSFSLMLATFMFQLRYPGAPCAFYEPTFRLIKDIAFPKAREVAELLHCDVKIKRADKEIDLYRGGRYYGTTFCHTMDDPENIMGSEYAHIAVDEMDRLTTANGLAAWQQIIARNRWAKKGVRDEDLRIRVGTTPEGFKSVYELFYNKPKPSYSMVQASTYENIEYLPKQYIPQLMETYDKELVQAYLLGKFVNLTAGTVYRSYDREEHRSTETVQGNEPVFVGMDFNIDRMAATVYVRRENGQQWHAVDEIHKGYDTTSVCETLKERYPENLIMVYPDASGGRRDTRDGASESDLAIITDRFRFRIGNAVKSRNPAVKDRVAATNAALEKSRLFINDDRCPNVAKCLEQQCYDKNDKPTKDGILDDQNDATTYPIAWEMPVRKPARQIKIGYAY